MLDSPPPHIRGSSRFLPRPDHERTHLTGLDLASVSRAIRALERRGLITADHRLAGVAGIQTVSGEAYLLTGLHPDGDDIADRLVNALQQAAEQVDPEEGGKLRRAAKALGDVTKSVASGVITGGLN